MRAEVERHYLGPRRFENTPEMLIVGVNGTYTFATRNNIRAQWARFAPRIGTVPGPVGKMSYGVCWNYKPGLGFDYLSGVEVSGQAGLPHEFSHVRLPTARYAVFTHRQPVSAIANTIDAIWKEWLPNSGHEATGAPSFERCTEEFNPQTGMGGTEIWIPIKA